MNAIELAMDVLSGGQSVLITMVAATPIQGPVVTLPTNHPRGAPVKCMVVPDAVCYVRKGANPTATGDGTDQKLLANIPVHIELMEGERLSFNSTAGGTVSFTPGA